MKKYRKIPVVIEAIQFIADGGACNPEFKTNRMFMQFPVYLDKDGEFLKIETLEGVMQARDKDWIIKGVNGEFYPCKPDIFEKSYELAEE